MLCLCAAQWKFCFQTDLGRQNLASYNYRQGRTVAFDFSHHGHALVTNYVQFLCSDWSKFDRWVHVENLCSILKLVYFDSWSWQSFVSTCDVFNRLFLLDVQEIQLLSRVFCYSWLVCFVGFWLRNTSPRQSRKYDLGWHRFRFLPCLKRKRVEKSEAILALLDSFQELHLKC